MNRRENNIKMVLKTNGKACTGLIWLGIIKGFHKMPGISGLGKDSALWNQQLGKTVEGNSVVAQQKFKGKIYKSQLQLINDMN